jgi:anti-sigma regulatory factor (Ser/Thr protein kinase)
LAARLQLDADLAEVARLNGWLAGIVAEAGAPKAVAEAAKLCLNELVANVILYGYPDGRAGRIEVSVAPEAGALRVTLEDDGIAFDPLAAPEAAPLDGLADDRIGGFGIKLFREAAHSAAYERSEGWNRLTFVCG